MTPGPSHYKIHRQNAGPKFVIGIKSSYQITSSKKKTTPGVGSYNVRESNGFSAKSPNAPRCSFGRAIRKGIPIKDGPSPSQYSPTRMEKIRAPRPFIPSSSRLGSAPLGMRRGRSVTNLKDLRANRQVPGPGEYYLPATIGNVSSYERTGNGVFQKV